MSCFIFFCIQIALIQYAIGQNINGPAMMNNGLPYGPNVGLGNPLQEQAIGRMGTGFSGVIGGPGIGQMGLNQRLGQSIPNAQTFAGTGMANPAYGSVGMANPAYGGVGMPNQIYGGTGMLNSAYGGAGKPNQAYGNAAGTPNPTYGGSGNGDVAVTGELPVSGMTSLTGHVPLTGKVAFNGNIPCGGVVTITGTCTSCGGNNAINVPYGQTSGYGNKPYGY